MVATLSKSGSGYNVSNRRSYDPWGNLRLGSIYTEPNGRYCANLGHKTDDESAMIYMRARYYEPSVGRFISEDPAMDGNNWAIYCYNNPVNKVDRDGKWGAVVGGVFLLLELFEAFWEPQDPVDKIAKQLLNSVLLGVGAVEFAISMAMKVDPRQLGMASAWMLVGAGVASIMFVCALSQIILLMMIINIDNDSLGAETILDKAGQLLVH
jgi:RHS repeat-associated protein